MPANVTFNSKPDLPPLSSSVEAPRPEVDAAPPGLPQHFLYFLPLPHGQGSFRPTFGSSNSTGVSDPTRGSSSSTVDRSSSSCRSRNLCCASNSANQRCRPARPVSFFTSHPAVRSGLSTALRAIISVEVRQQKVQPSRGTSPARAHLFEWGGAGDASSTIHRKPYWFMTLDFRGRTAFAVRLIAASPKQRAFSAMTF